MLIQELENKKEDKKRQHLPTHFPGSELFFAFKGKKTGFLRALLVLSKISFLLGIV